MLMKLGARLLVTTLLATLLSAMAIVVVTCPPARADIRQAKQRREAYDQNLENELAKIAPSATSLFAEANRTNADDPERALALYEKVTDLAPSFTPAIRRRAMLLAETGRRTDGIALARKAVGMSSSVENKTALALILAHPPGNPPVPIPGEDFEAISLMKDASTRAPNDIDVQLSLCEVLLATHRADELQTEAALAVRLAPDEPQPHVYAALASALHDDRSAAYASIDTARRHGLDPQLADRLTRAIDASEPPLFKWGKRGLLFLALWIVGLLALFASGVALSRMTLRFVRRLSDSSSSSSSGPESESNPYRDPNDPSDRDEQRLVGGAWLRAVYRALLHIASLYYYTSLPLILLITVVGGAGVILGFFYIGRIPIIVVALAGTLVLVTIGSVFKSLRARTRDVDPGVPVDLEKHVRLRAVITEVAERVGTRVVDEVYITPSAGIAVLERGTMLRQLRGNTERCLVLGVGVLEGMKIAPFKAVLAHEYGHFSNRDTAGGGLALSVRRSLLNTALSLAEGGAAVWYSPMWHFLVWFQRIFLRISQGASRLQEVMADRIAVFAYGSDAFVEGLGHVVRRNIELEAHVHATLAEVVDDNQRANTNALANLYTYKPEKTVEVADIEEAVKEAMESEPSPYDSHPRPVDRIALARALSSTMSKRARKMARSNAAPGSEHETTDAWTLFASREEIEQRMTSELRASLSDRGIVTWSEADAG